jgi:hypothetical protein
MGCSNCRAPKAAQQSFCNRGTGRSVSTVSNFRTHDKKKVCTTTVIVVINATVIIMNQFFKQRTFNVLEMSNQSDDCSDLIRSV